MAFDFLIIIILLVIPVILIEVTFYIGVSYVRKNFQWLITSKDEDPKLSQEGLKKFIPHGYDPELGWVRKPNTSHDESGKFGTTRWNINPKGARYDPDHENLESKISCYGDSFAFCRQVNDDETWEYYLSKLQNTNVQNFGVGNYGIDQSLLRLKREFQKNKTNLVILAVVPDTISRIMSMWKHYYEYGNTFAFKPRFIIENGNLHLLKNKIDDESKFYNYRIFLDQIQQEDFFYKRKFKKELIRFPYSLTTLKNLRRNLSILFWFTFIQMLKKLRINTSKIDWNPMRAIMKINLKWRIRLYHNKESTYLLRKIIENFVSYAKEQQFTPLLVFLPQKDDVLFIKKHYHFYQSFMDSLDTINGLYYIDISKYFQIEHDLDLLYSDNNEYGGHFSKIGNEKVASLINYDLIKLGLDQR